MTRVGERVRFRSTSGPTLAGLVDLPHRELRGWGVFAHGFTLGKDSPAANRICKQLASEGIGMLRFDNLGLGDSLHSRTKRPSSRGAADAKEIAKYPDPDITIERIGELTSIDFDALTTKGRR